MAETPLTLGYWGIRGRAQPVRYLLEFLGLPYEEKRYTDPAQWFGVDK
jgi:glutathione S-transferase